MIARREMLLALGGLAATGCATDPSKPRTIRFDALTTSRISRGLDRAAQAHYTMTTVLVGIGKAAIKAGKLKLAGADLDAYLADATKLKTAWDAAYDGVQDQIASAKEDAIIDPQVLGQLVAALGPLADLALKVAPLLAGLAL